MIYISCINDRDQAEFSLRDVSTRAARVIKSCVDGDVDVYGGYEGIGGWESFYVSVGVVKEVGDVGGTLGANESRVVEVLDNAVNRSLVDQ